MQNNSDPTLADVYKEMMSSVRYYGSVRYILFPLYITLTGVLVGVLYKNEYLIPQYLLKVVGLCSSIAWFVFEFSLSESIRLTWKEIEKIFQNINFPSGGAHLINPIVHRNWYLTFFPRVIFYLIYFSGIIYWIAMLFHDSKIIRCG